MIEAEAEDTEAATSKAELEAMADLITIMQQSSGDLHKTEIREEGHGTHRVFDVTTVRSLATTNMNVERNSQISTEAISISPTVKENTQIPCFFHAIS